MPALLSFRSRKSDKPASVAPARQLLEMGFEIIATRGTAKYLQAAGLEVRMINKVLEGRPHIVDALKNGEVQLVFNTTEGAQSLADSFSIRRTALQQKVPYYTTIAGFVGRDPGYCRASGWRFGVCALFRPMADSGTFWPAHASLEVADEPLLQ